MATSGPRKSVNISDLDKSESKPLIEVVDGDTGEPKAEQNKRAKLTPDIEAQLKEAFGVFDVSGDGQIDALELQMILQAVNKREVDIEEVKEMMNSVDDSGDGEIQLEEFLELMAIYMNA